MDQSSNGTNSTYNKLDSTEKATLALLKGTPVYEVMIKAINFYQKDKAAFAIATSPDWEHLVGQRGEINGSQMIVNLIDYAAKKQEKHLEAKKAIEKIEEAK